MKTTYTLKNFRLFDNTGATVEFSPLTFLVGCNSSGKSSIVKSLTLLKSFFKHEVTAESPVIGTSIDFSTYPNSTLGSFGNTVRSSAKEKVISLAYTVHSSYINEDVKVSLDLVEGELGDAVVSAISISRLDGTVLAAAKKFAKEKGRSVSGDMVPLKDAFKRYLIAVRFRAQTETLLCPEPFVYCKNNEGKVDELYSEAQKYCDERYLNEVYTNWSVKPIKLNDQAKLSVDKFAESDIITYLAILDELKGLEKTEDIRAFLKARINEEELKDVLVKAIDTICEDYFSKGEPGFLNYYRALEDYHLSSHFPTRAVFSDYLIGPDLFVLGSKNSDFVCTFRDRNEVDLTEGNVDNSCNQIAVCYPLVHDVLVHLSDNDPYYQVIKEVPDYPASFRFVHPLLESSFKQFINLFIKEVVSKDITEDVAYISSSRIQVRRMYSLEDVTEFSKAVKRYFDTKVKYMELNPPLTLNVENEDERGTHPVVVSSFMPGDFMNKWLRAFNIGDHFSLEMDNYGLGLLLKVYKTPSDKKGMLLADMGYGITQLFSVLLQIEEMIMAGLYDRFVNKVAAKKGEIGARVLSSYKDMPLSARTVAIEEPEIHLHPRFQSLLADMFLEAYKEYNIQFVIETHSEYLLRKNQALVGAGKLMPEEISLVYVEDDATLKKETPKVRSIRVKKDGCLSEPFGPGFYDEADNLSLSLFTKPWKNSDVQ